MRSHNVQNKSLASYYPTTKNAASNMRTENVSEVDDRKSPLRNREGFQREIQPGLKGELCPTDLNFEVVLVDMSVHQPSFQRAPPLYDGAE